MRKPITLLYFNMVQELGAEEGFTRSRSRRVKHSDLILLPFDYAPFDYAQGKLRLRSGQGSG